MCRFACVLIAFFVSTAAFAGGLPYLVGAEASVEAISQVFASPSLPSLDSNGHTLTPMIAFATVKGVDDSSSIPAGQTSSVFAGEVRGNAASLTFNSAGKGDFGYYVVLAETKLSGEMTSTIGGATDTVKDISASGLTGAAGASYRLLGSEKSIFALGLFAGPAYMSVSSSENVDQSNGKRVSVNFNRDFYGIYGGIQLLFRIGNFRINPYFSTFDDKSEHCRNDLDFKGVVNVISLCQGGQQGFEVDSTIYGLGLNLGYGPFSLNVYSDGAGVHRYLKATNYALSYSFHF